MPIKRRRKLKLYKDALLRDADFLQTPIEAVQPLVDYLPELIQYVEPCYGHGAIVRALETLTDCHCVGWGGAQVGDTTGWTGLDARSAKVSDYGPGPVQMFITNPPFKTPIVYDILENLRRQRPTWMLLPSDFPQRRRSSEYMRFCSLVVPIGQIRWFKDSPSKGRQNFSWYLFEPTATRTRFMPIDPNGYSPKAKMPSPKNIHRIRF